MNSIPNTDMLSKISAGTLSKEDLDQIIALPTDALRTLIMSVTEKFSLVEQSHARINTIFEASPQPILIIDDNHTITNNNPSFLTMCGFSRNEVIGKPLKEFSPEIYAMMVRDQESKETDFITVNFRQVSGCWNNTPLRLLPHQEPEMK